MFWLINRNNWHPEVYKSYTRMQLLPVLMYKLLNLVSYCISIQSKSLSLYMVISVLTWSNLKKFCVSLQIWFNEAMRRVLVEKDRQLENLRMHSVHVESECQKHRETIHRLTGTSGLVWAKYVKSSVTSLVADIILVQKKELTTKKKGPALQDRVYLKLHETWECIDILRNYLLKTLS